jgi:hypothetical protein
MTKEESPLSALAALARVCQNAKREKNTETQCLDMVVLHTGWMHVLARMWYERRDKCEQLDDKAFLLDSAKKIKKNLSIPVRKNREQGLEGVDQMVLYSIRCENLGCNGIITLKSEKAKEAYLNTQSAFAAAFPGTTVVPQPQVLVIKE